MICRARALYIIAACVSSGDQMLWPAFGPDIAWGTEQVWETFLFLVFWPADDMKGTRPASHRGLRLIAAERVWGAFLFLVL